MNAEQKSGAWAAEIVLAHAIERVKQAERADAEAHERAAAEPYRSAAMPEYLAPCAARGMHLSLEEAKGYAAALDHLRHERDEANSKVAAIEAERERAGFTVVFMLVCSTVFGVGVAVAMLIFGGFR